MEFIVYHNQNSLEWCVLGRQVGADFWQQFGRWYRSRGWAERKKAEIERAYFERVAGRR